jgi:hypothetical protein
MHVWAINDDPGTDQPKVVVYTAAKSASDAEANYKLNLTAYKSFHKNADPPPDGTVHSVEYVGFCPLSPLTIRSLSTMIKP